MPNKICTEDLQFIEFNGFRLASSIHKPGSNAYPAVLMLHGFTGNRIEAHRLFVDIARRLCSEGIAVLRFDYRGHGESSLSFEEFKLSYAIEDAEKALEKLKRLFNPIAIGLVGLSLGGYVATYLAAHHREVSSLVLLAPAIKLDELSKNTLLLVKREDDYIVLGPHRLKMEGVESLATANAMRFAEQISSPTLIIHAKNDSVVPYQHSVEFYQKLKSNTKSLLILDEGGHVFDVFHIRARVIEEVVNWFINTLIR